MKSMKRSPGGENVWLSSMERRPLDETSYRVRSKVVDVLKANRVLDFLGSFDRQKAEQIDKTLEGEDKEKPARFI
jgi:hypothetical protein